MSRLPAAGRAVALAVLLGCFGLLLAAVALRWGPLHRLDVRVANDLHRYARQHAGQVSWWKWVSRIAQPAVERGAWAVAAIVLWIRGQRWTPVFALVATAGAALLESALKVAVGRHRPVFADPVAHAPGYSFPSGHALASFVAFGLLVIVVPRAVRPVSAVVAVLVVVLVGFSRLILGVHYLSDVVGGWLLAAACLVATYWTFETRLHRGVAASQTEFK